MRKIKRFLLPTSFLLAIAILIIIVNHKRIERLFVLSVKDDLLWGTAYAGNIETVRALLAEGADVNFRHKNSGWTPLMAAADQGHLEIVELLLAKGADVNAETKDGFTALVNAIESGRADIVQVLLDHGASPSIVYGRAGITPLLDAAFVGNVTSVLALLAKGADVNAPGGNGTTALMGAAAAGQEEVVRLLLQHGADVSAKRDDGKTAFSLAKEEGHEKIAELLLDAGATTSRK